MDCMFVTHLKLTNTRFCVIYVSMNIVKSKVHLMVKSKVINSQGLMKAIYMGIFFFFNGACNVRNVHKKTFANIPLERSTYGSFLNLN